MTSVSQFPKFDDGDVCIVISPSQTYRLHSHTLSRLSPYFRHQFSAMPGAKLTAAARRDGATPWYFELNTCTYLPESFGKFVPFKVSDGGKVLRDNYNFPNLESAFGQDAQREGRIWDWLFGTFYNIAPKFEDYNLAIVLHSCLGLVDAADSIGAIDHVREIVDLALLRQDRVLWRSIAANPAVWTELGYRVHSQSIFCEGMVHLTGIWPKMNEEQRSELRPEIRSLVERKHAELDFAKQVIEIRILGHYPSFLSRSHVDKPQRTSYSSDIYMWMAVSFFRQFFAQAISECDTRNALDGGWKFYNAVAMGGNAYLNHEDFQAFYQYFPMSSKACHVLQANMNVLKEDVKVFVKDLTVSRVHVKPEDYPIEWLTCAVVEKGDLPWEIQESGTDAGLDQSRQGLGPTNDHLAGEEAISTPIADTGFSIAFDVNKAASEDDGTGVVGSTTAGLQIGGDHAMTMDRMDPADPLSPTGNEDKDLNMGRNSQRPGIGRVGRARGRSSHHRN